MLIDENILRITPSDEVNGCGPKRFGNWVRDKILGLSIKNAGNIHDCHYYWLSKMKSKSCESQVLKDFDGYLWKRLGRGKDYADSIFLKNMTIINNNSSSKKFIKKLRLPIIKSYFLAVRFFGIYFL